MPWIPILGAAVCFLLGKIAQHYFGITGALVFVVGLLIAWLGFYVWYRIRIRNLCAQVDAMDEAAKMHFLAQIDPDLRKDIEEMRAYKGR